MRLPAGPTITCYLEWNDKTQKKFECSGGMWPSVVAKSNASQWQAYPLEEFDPSKQVMADWRREKARWHAIIK